MTARNGIVCVEWADPAELLALDARRWPGLTPFARANCCGGVPGAVLFPILKAWKRFDDWRKEPARLRTLVAKLLAEVGSLRRENDGLRDRISALLEEIHSRVRVPDFTQFAEGRADFAHEVRSYRVEGDWAGFSFHVYGDEGPEAIRHMAERAAANVGDAVAKQLELELARLLTKQAA